MKKWLCSWGMVYIPVTVLVAALVIVALSGRDILPFDFNTARGYTAIGVIGLACLAIEFVGCKKIPKKGE